jgi:hypothetical protein
MKLTWKIEKRDIQRIKSFCRQYEHNLFVQKRIKKNVNQTNHEVDEIRFWKVMVACLLSTQQRSGPYSAVTNFLLTEPFPLAYSFCLHQGDLTSFVEETIVDFGGIRRSGKIAGEISDNFSRLTGGGWKEVLSMIQTLQNDRTPAAEREAARFIKKKLKGFGSKQSRNLLQSLGLTRYEIPVDSRITRWLNDFGFPVKLSADGLSDENYYSFIMDGIQELCKESGIYPCVLDAAIFASFDPDWSEDRLVW